MTVYLTLWSDCVPVCLLAHESSVSPCEGRLKLTLAKTHQMLWLHSLCSNSGSMPLLLLHLANVNTLSHHPGPEGGMLICPNMFSLTWGASRPDWEKVWEWRTAELKLFMRGNTAISKYSSSFGNLNQFQSVSFIISLIFAYVDFKKGMFVFALIWVFLIKLLLVPVIFSHANVFGLIYVDKFFPHCEISVISSHP